jgi:hypothetical protein
MSSSGACGIARMATHPRCQVQAAMIRPQVQERIFTTTLPGGTSLSMCRGDVAGQSRQRRC